MNQEELKNAGKMCIDCGVSLTENNFTASRLKTKNYFCNDCSRKRNSVKKRNNIVGIRKKQKEWAKRNRPKKSVRHKENIAVQNKLHWAVQKGDVIKPKFCACCAQAKPSLHAHHKDYSRPYDVIWLCPACHMFLHQQLKDACTLAFASMLDREKLYAILGKSVEFDEDGNAWTNHTKAVDAILSAMKGGGK